MFRKDKNKNGARRENRNRRVQQKIRSFQEEKNLKNNQVKAKSIYERKMKKRKLNKEKSGTD